MRDTAIVGIFILRAFCVNYRDSFQIVHRAALSLHWRWLITTSDIHPSQTSTVQPEQYYY